MVPLQLPGVSQPEILRNQPLLLKRLRDTDEYVRGLAEQGLWRLWSRSGEAAVDRLMAAGIEQMQAARFREAIATFSEVIRRKRLCLTDGPGKSCGSPGAA